MARAGQGPAWFSPQPQIASEVLLETQDGREKWDRLICWTFSEAPEKAQLRTKVTASFHLNALSSQPGEDERDVRPTVKRFDKACHHKPSG
jgi:hypothetical protein